MALELCHGKGFRSMKSDALQGQSSLRNACSVTQCLSQDLTLFSRNPALLIDLNPARNSTVHFGILAQLSPDLSPPSEAASCNSRRTRSGHKAPPTSLGICRSGLIPRSSRVEACLAAQACRFQVLRSSRIAARFGPNAKAFGYRSRVGSSLGCDRGGWCDRSGASALPTACFL